MEELKRFEKAINEDPELGKKLDEAARQIMAEGKAGSDGELLVKAAAELGFTFTVSDLEKSTAESQEIDLEEMTAVSGGRITKHKGDCLFCDTQVRVDQDGHNGLCITAWHCYTAFMHTEVDKDDKKDVACWTDYTCELLAKGTC